PMSLYICSPISSVLSRFFKVITFLALISPQRHRVSRVRNVSLIENSFTLHPPASAVRYPVFLFRSLCPSRFVVSPSLKHLEQLEHLKQMELAQRRHFCASVVQHTEFYSPQRN